MSKGIDISSYQGKPNWGQVSQAVDFAILRITQKYGVDESFEHNYAGATKHGVKLGVYKLSYAQTKQAAKQEVDGLLQTLAGRPLDLPIFLDLEDAGKQQYLPAETIYKIVRVFEKNIKAAGYMFGIYCNLYWYKDIIPEKLKNRKFWIASYPLYDKGQVVETLKPSQVRKLYCWQYSERGQVPGIDGDVDMDIWYGKPKAVPAATYTVTADKIVETAESFLGVAQGSQRHMELVDMYNAHEPLAQGYRATYADSWCDIFVSDVFLLNNAEALIGGTECGVQRHVALFKQLGIWHDRQGYTPTRGDIIVFDWDKGGFADHIGIVAFGSKTYVRTVEGNASGVVRQREYNTADSCIVGYARPKYGERLME